jgi:hypothetical protein
MSKKANQDRLFEVEYAITILLLLAYGFIELSILFFYRRLFILDKN